MISPLSIFQVRKLRFEEAHFRACLWEAAVLGLEARLS